MQGMSGNEVLENSLLWKMLGDGIDEHDSRGDSSDLIHRRMLVEIVPVESKTQTHHGPVGSGRRTAGRQGGAGLGRTGRRWVDPARRQPSLLPSSESKTLS